MLLDVKGAVMGKDFIMCEERMINEMRMLDMVGEDEKGCVKLPFVIFFDSRDPSSAKYVKFKCKDLEKMNMEVIMIDIDNSIDHIGGQFSYFYEKYKMLKYLPFIIQIPSDKELLKDFKWKQECIELSIKDKMLPVYSFDEYEVDQAFKKADVDCLVGRTAEEHFKDQIETIDYTLGIEELKEQINNLIIPATPKGIILYLLEECGPLVSKRVSVVGSNSVTTGRFLTPILLKLKATPTLYHSKSVISVGEFNRQDIIISCVGKPGVITPLNLSTDMHKEQVCMDVGVTVVDGKVKGDFSLECRNHRNIKITTYTNAVGLLTRTALKSNIIRSYKELFSL